MNSINKIKILSPEQAIKIAAGEVVERPANIIKEIVENSIDAGATKISIFIHESGKKLIKIIDNGLGMSAHDVKLSVAAHATSKINRVEDLESITTFGFRGEALASINSVSNLTITSKTDESQTGTRIEWKFGKLQTESIESHATGTTIQIANLFDNIPARQKFLKKDETEWRTIITLFQAFCLDILRFIFNSTMNIKFNSIALLSIKFLIELHSFLRLISKKNFLILST
jgi:DNA mismatch repair protein MutL